jgi:hypothetical protein
MIASFHQKIEEEKKSREEQLFDTLKRNWKELSHKEGQESRCLKNRVALDKSEAQFPNQDVIGTMPSEQ